MAYGKKILILLIIITALVIANIATFIPDFGAAAKSSYTWLEERFISYADKIEITGSHGSIVLSRKNDLWVISGYDENAKQAINYPVNQAKINDFLAVLTRSGNYPVRSVSGSSAAQLGFDADASRIVVRGGIGLPLLDLEIGFIDHTGSIFLRRAGQNEIRSGEDRFTLYTENEKTFWYDLRIFADLMPAMVQGISFSFAQSNAENINLARERNAWINADTGIVYEQGESLVRAVLEARGEDFITVSNMEYIGTIGLWLGSGAYKSLVLGSAGGRNFAVNTETGLIYLLSEWTLKRILPVSNSG